MVDNLKKETLRQEYIARINKVQDYIETHQREELSLQRLAGIANFSSYHFHRIFTSLTGEPLFQYIQRIRLERAAFLLVANSKKSIAEIAMECGFSNQSSFARAFKRHFKLSAGALRVKSDILLEKSKNGTTESNSGKDLEKSLMYNIAVTRRNQNTWVERFEPGLPLDVEIKEIEEFNIIYIRHTGPYKADAKLFTGLFNKLRKWAEARELINPNTKWVILSHDNPELTAEHRLRISVGMTVSGNTKVEGEVGKLSIAGGKYAVGHFFLETDQYQEAWDSLFIKWLPESGYQPDDRLNFELYSNLQGDSPLTKKAVDLYIPVRPL